MDVHYPPHFFKLQKGRHSPSILSSQRFRNLKIANMTHKYPADAYCKYKYIFHTDIVNFNVKCIYIYLVSCLVEINLCNL